MENELKVVICVPRTPKQFLLHGSTAVHVCKQNGLDTNYANTSMALEAAYCKLDAAKTEYAHLEKATKKKAKEQKENSANLDPDVNAMSSPLQLPREHAKKPPQKSTKQSLPS